MATIETRHTQGGKIRYRAVIRSKGHPVQRKTFELKTKAKEWVQRTEAAIKEGRYFKTIEGKRHTLSEAIDRYLAEIMPQKPKSTYTQGIQLKWWRERIGAYLLADITPALIVEHRAALLERVSPSTANNYMAVLSHVFTVCVREWEWLDDSPTRKVSRLKQSRGRNRYLSKEELPALLDACKASPNPDLYAVVIVALSTGCRKNEILSLRWGNVDLERGQITLLDTKNGTPRAVPLVGHAQDVLKERSRIRRLDTDLVFPRKNQTIPILIDYDFRQARAAAGIKDFRFHDLRHTAASYLAMNGASLAEIAAVLGHKTLQMVQRYAHLSDAHTSAVVARMNAKMFEGEETNHARDKA